MEPQPSLAPRVAELLHVTLESQGITMEKIATKKKCVYHVGYILE